MSAIYDFLSRYVWVLLIIGGLLVIVGVILDWDWLTNAENDRRAWPGQFIHTAFGKTGYRIYKGFLGVVLIAVGAFCLITMNK